MMAVKAILPSFNQAWERNVGLVKTVHSEFVIYVQNTIKAIDKLVQAD